MKITLSMIAGATLGLCVALGVVYYATDPQEGHTYTKHINCDQSFKVLTRKGDIVTFLDEQSGQVKTVTVKEFKNL
jgi:hypothetical protein